MVSLTSLLNFRARHPRGPAFPPQDDTTSLSGTDPDSHCDIDSDGELPPASSDFGAVPLPPVSRDAQPAAAAVGLSARAVADIAAAEQAACAAEAVLASPTVSPAQSKHAESDRPSACAALSATKAAAVPSCPKNVQASDSAAACSTEEPIGVRADAPAAVETEAFAAAEPNSTGKAAYFATNTANRIETAALAAARQPTTSSCAIPPGSTTACSAGGAQLPAAGEAPLAAVQASAPHQLPCGTAPGGPPGAGPTCECPASCAVIVDAQNVMEHQLPSAVPRSVSYLAACAPVQACSSVAIPGQ